MVMFLLLGSREILLGQLLAQPLAWGPHCQPVSPLSSLVIFPASEGVDKLSKEDDHDATKVPRWPSFRGKPGSTHLLDGSQGAVGDS